LIIVLSYEQKHMVSDMILGAVNEWLGPYNPVKIFSADQSVIDPGSL